MSTKPTHNPVWTARCKSGYEFPHDVTLVRIGRISVTRTVHKPCGRLVSRGALLCPDCMAAEIMRPVVIEDQAPRLDWLGMAVQESRQSKGKVQYA